MQPRPQPMRHDACRASIEPGADARGASATTPGYGGRSAARPKPDATRADESPGRIQRSTPPAGLECRQTALGWRSRSAFFERFHRDYPGAQHCQQGQGPIARVICRYHPDQLRQRGSLGGKDHLSRQLGRAAAAAPDQHPTAPGGLRRISQGQPAPIIPTGAFGPLSGTEAGPTLCSQCRHDGLHLLRSPAQPDTVFAETASP
jgi:hypothetical protein